TGCAPVTRTLCLDARMLQSSGIGTYLQGLLSGIRAARPLPYSLCLLGNPAKLPPGPWTTEAVAAPIYSVQEQWIVPLALRRQKSAVLHSPHYNMPIVMASQTIVTVHDVIHLKFPQYWPSAVARAYAHFFFHHVI